MKMKICEKSWKNLKNNLKLPKGYFTKRYRMLHLNKNNSAEDSFMSSADGGETIQLPVTTVDAVIADLKLERVDFIKMDIEGSEPQALRGASGTLARFRPGEL